MRSTTVKDPFSCFSHLFGAVAAIPGLVWLILRADGDPWRTVGFAVFGASMAILYSASALYHGLKLSPQGDDWLRRIDHTAIFVLIAGTYTPVCLVTLRGPWGWSLFGVVWGLAALGAVTKLGFRHMPRWLTTSVYVAMGWIAVIAMAPLVRALSGEGLAWLFAGGGAYTVGAIIYGIEFPNPLPNVFGSHDIFHVFVLAGTACHYVFMLRGVIPAAL